MTSPCEFDDLDCPQEENFAAIAKQLHETAAQAEERIYCMEQQLRSAVNRPTYVTTTTADMGSFAANVGTSPNDFWAIFLPFHAKVVNFSNILEPQNTGLGWKLPTGLWHIGAFVASFSVGAASDNTYRQLLVMRIRVNPSTGGILPILDEASHTSFESANGVQILMTASGVFRIEGDDTILFGFKHGNIASNVSVATGAIAWFTRLSDSDVVRVI